MGGGGRSGSGEPGFEEPVRSGEQGEPRMVCEGGKWRRSHLLGPQEGLVDGRSCKVGAAPDSEQRRPARQTTCTSLSNNKNSAVVHKPPWSCTESSLAAAGFHCQRPVARILLGRPDHPPSPRSSPPPHPAGLVNMPRTCPRSWRSQLLPQPRCTPVGHTELGVRPPIQGPVFTVGGTLCDLLRLSLPSQSS